MTHCPKEEKGKVSYKVSDSKNQEDVGWCRWEGLSLPRLP